MEGGHICTFSLREATTRLPSPAPEFGDAEGDGAEEEMTCVCDALACGDGRLCVCSVCVVCVCERVPESLSYRRL